VAIAAAALLATALPASARAGDPEVIADNLTSPLSLAIADDGTVYAAQNFAGLITKVGETDPIYSDSDSGNREIGAFSVSGDTLTFGASIPGQDVKMYTYHWDGSAYQQTEIADLWAWEKAHNPDHVNTYGIMGLSKSCLKATPKDYRPYKGRKDSHAYASTTVDGITYVADAGANAIIAINGDTVSTLAVLPPTKIKITKAARKELKAPKCALGKTFRAEPVPTDVEVGPDGNLYVSSLPGGPENPQAMGANGAIFQVMPQDGMVQRVGTGLVSPTGLAIAADGTAYVAQLFAGNVLEIPFGGTPSVFAEVAAPGDVDLANGSLYVTASGLSPDGPPGPGQVLKYALD
jgi:hypothetical protein